jgi:REP element-mobilizing transposase RayT
MADTYTQIYLQIVFAVKGRESLVLQSWENQLYKYITGIVQNKSHKMLAINGMPNHIHFLIGMKPSSNISDLVREIKKSSNEYVNKHKLTRFKFQWQEGYGAFTYCHNHLSYVIGYIANQKEHHKKKTFSEEYTDILKSFNIEYQNERLFESIA